MNADIMFYLNSVAFGVGLAMDAFSVSMANGLREPNMGKLKICGIAGTFAAFQTAMPLIGWLCVHTVAAAFESAERFIPWIALVLLLYIGGKMIFESFSGEKDGENAEAVGVTGIIVQGIATSIDALSVGFTISELGVWDALTESLIIGFVTFFICVGGVEIGKRFGMRLESRASVLGGVILIAIGVEIFISGIWG